MVGRSAAVVGALAASVACGSHAGMDAPSGPQTVTIDKTKAFGLVTSDPPGILCGECANFGGCGSGVTSGSACSADFDAGTSLTLRLTEEETRYYRYFCWTSEDPAPVQHNCIVTVDKPMTVFVEGVTGP